MRTMCSREIFTKKCLQQQIFDSDLKGAWHYNHVTFTPIAKKFMLYCRLIYILSILCVRLTIKVKVGIPESFKVGWYSPKKKLGRVTLSTYQQFSVVHILESFLKCIARYWFIASSAKKSNNITSKSWKHLRGEFPWIFMEPKTFYRWFPMISGHGTIELFSMGFEILGLACHRVY